MTLPGADGGPSDSLEHVEREMLDPRVGFDDLIDVPCRRTGISMAIAR